MVTSLLWVVFIVLTLTPEVVTNEATPSDNKALAGIDDSIATVATPQSDLAATNNVDTSKDSIDDFHESSTSEKLKNYMKLRVKNDRKKKRKGNDKDKDTTDEEQEYPMDDQDTQGKTDDMDDITDDLKKKRKARKKKQRKERKEKNKKLGSKVHENLLDKS
ncbi:uncharacterized protein LOC130628884 [Hydractinia symbiolongicarpus]|uniref:uncharacterized protein LOC130628884 n=1 Tax=Hydractinia symbiolongicarpus TaxID=13093 RepID=UPI00254AEBB4|nr:uncharacterized protein LOC130628884 [Hydractinia symbiolongicarpus]